MSVSPVQLPTKNSNILIIARDHPHLQCVVDTLSTEGYCVHQMSDARQALSSANLTAFDLILLTTQQPETDGYEVCRLLKAQPQVHGIPIILLNTLDQPIDRVKAFESGCTDYLDQPFHAIELLIKVAQQLRLKQLLAETSRQQEQREAHSQQIDDMNQELMLFTSSVSHDLRSPLRGLQGLSKALLEDYDSQLDELGTTYLQRIEATAITMNKLLDDLVTYSRIRRTKVSIKPVSLEAVIHSALESMMPIVKGTQATVKVQPNLPQVMGDAPVLDQIIKSLLDNALKYITPGTQPLVNISASLTDGSEIESDATDSTPTKQTQVRLIFQDNGIGISFENQAKIFLPFSRLHGVEAYPGLWFWVGHCSARH